MSGNGGSIVSVGPAFVEPAPPLLSIQAHRVKEVVVQAILVSGQFIQGASILSDVVDE